MEEEAPENFGDREDEMMIRHRLEHMLADPFAKFHDPFLVTRGAEIPALRKSFFVDLFKRKRMKAGAFRDLSAMVPSLNDTGGVDLTGCTGV